MSVLRDAELDAAPIATYMKTAVDFKETNPNKEKRTIYFRRRPIHALVSQPRLRRFVQSETTGHWAIEVGEYIWELEKQSGMIGYHIGVWKNPGEVDGRRLLATEREKIGDTLLSDHEIKEAADQVKKAMSRRRNLWGAVLLPYKLPLILSRIFSQKRYDETLNNCQDFAAQLAASIDFETGISEKRTMRLFGRDARINYYNAEYLPLANPSTGANIWFLALGSPNRAKYIWEALQNYGKRK